MIIGIGTDITDARRIEKILKERSEQFIKRIFSAEEAEYARKYEGIEKQALAFARRFAAKEAAAKALRTGFGYHDIIMKDITVTKSDLGAPSLMFSGAAKAYLQKITPEKTNISAHLSLSDEPPYAQAFVVLESTAF